MAGALRGAFAGAAIAPAVKPPSIVLASNKVITGRVITFVSITFTRTTFSPSLSPNGPIPYPASRALYGSLPEARHPIKRDRLFQSPKDTRSFNVTNIIKLNNSANPDRKAQSMTFGLTG